MKYIHHTDDWVVDLVWSSKPTSLRIPDGLISFSDSITDAELKTDFNILPVIENRPYFNPVLQKLVAAGGAQIGDIVPEDADYVTQEFTIVRVSGPYTDLLTPALSRRAKKKKSELKSKIKQANTLTNANILIEILEETENG